MMPFQDRRAAGRALAKLLQQYRGQTDVLVLGLARGGVPVAAEVAAQLHAPLDVLVVRKLGAPGQPELAIGAIASGGVMLIHEGTLALHEDSSVLSAEVARQRAELRRREALYRNAHLPQSARDRAVILVDDGAATGASMRAAIRAIRERGARRVIAAVPVASTDALAALRSAADEVACVHAPTAFRSVGEWYEKFEQTSDAEVAALLCDARALPDTRPPQPSPSNAHGWSGSHRQSEDE